MIDTNLAAQSAARMLSAGLNKPATNTNNPPRQESALFKQMKAGLNKSHSTTMSNMLEKSHGPETTKSHPQQKQVGRDQTYTPTSPAPASHAEIPDDFFATRR